MTRLRDYEGLTVRLPAATGGLLQNIQIVVGPTNWVPMVLSAILERLKSEFDLFPLSRVEVKNLWNDITPSSPLRARGQCSVLPANH